MTKLLSVPDYLLGIDMTKVGAVINPTGIDGLPTTSASIKTKIEGIDGGVVVFLEGTYTIDATIAPNANTKIIGLGNVQLDWGGTADGYMFSNAAATGVYYNNLYWIKTGNNYRPVALRNYDILDNCKQDDTGSIIYVAPTTSASILNCRNLYYVYVQGVGTVIHNSGIAYRLELWRAYNTRASDSTINVIIIYDNHVYTSDVNIKFSNCDIIQTVASGIDSCVYIYTGATSLHEIKNIKFNHCLFEPFDNGDDCILLENDAYLSVTDLEFDHCKFRDFLNCYTAGANPTISRWKFDNGEYEDMAAGGVRHNYTTTPLGFIKTNDGGYD